MERKEKLNRALCDIRKAHRMIYSYQQRMLGLMKFISAKLDFAQISGVKHFSNDMYKRRNGYIDVHGNMWAWDFLYSYLFQYYLGEKEIEGGDSIALSVVQYSDTGFFENSNNDDRTDIASFAAEEESASKLLFIIERKPKGAEWEWNIEELVNNKEYASKNHTCCILECGNGGRQCLYSFAIEDFIDEKTALESLERLCGYCRDTGFADIRRV